MTTTKPADIDIEVERKAFEAWFREKYGMPDWAVFNWKVEISTDMFVSWLAAKRAALIQGALNDQGKISVLADLLREVLMPLSVSKMDAMTSGEDEDYQMIRDLEKRIKNAINDINKGGEFNSHPFILSPSDTGSEG